MNEWNLQFVLRSRVALGLKPGDLEETCDEVGDDYQITNKLLVLVTGSSYHILTQEVFLIKTFYCIFRLYYPNLCF